MICASYTTPYSRSTLYAKNQLSILHIVIRILYQCTADPASLDNRNHSPSSRRHPRASLFIRYATASYPSKSLQQRCRCQISIKMGGFIVLWGIGYNYD